MGTLFQDVRFGIRQLLRAPVVTLVAAVSVALGIGAATTAFSLAHSFLFEPVPFGDPGSLVAVGEGDVEAEVAQLGGPTVGSFREYEEGITSLAGATGFRADPANLTGVDMPEQLQVATATPNIFRILQGDVALGRDFRPEEGVDGRDQVVILTHDFWERRFQADRDILGRTITLDDEAFTVIGVAAPEFEMLPATVDLFRPSDFADERNDFSGRSLQVFARLAPGATLERANAEAASVFRGIADRYPEETRGRRVQLATVSDAILGRSDKLLVIIMSLVTIFGLLIACVNVANLLLARAEERQKEVAVRTALGAGRGRIVRQLLTESVLLGSLAGAAGIGLSVFGIRWLRGAMPPVMPRSMLPDLDGPVLTVTIAVSLLCGVVFGLAPALHAVRGDLRESLGEGTRGGTASRARRRLRNAFVVAEFAVALALLAGSAFLLDAFQQLFMAETGFRQEGLATFFISAPEYRFEDDEALTLYHRELLASLEEVPGNRGVAAMTRLPRGQSGTPGRTFEIPGQVLPEDADRPRTILQAVNPDFFPTMEIELVQGRGVEFGDRADAQPVVIISRSFVRREFRDGDPLGRQILLGGEEEPRTVVGVAEDAVFQRIVSGDVPQAYVPLAQFPVRTMNFALRFDDDPLSAAAEIRQAVWAVNPDQPVDDLRTLDDYIRESLAGAQAISLFMGAMGFLALLLASMGIYGVMAQAVVQQTREIGIRRALGAGRPSVLGMVTRSGMKLVGIGMLIGIPLSGLMALLVQNSLGDFDARVALPTGLVVAALLGSVSLLAVLLPAFRASAVAPAEALREG